MTCLRRFTAFALVAMLPNLASAQVIEEENLDEINPSTVAPPTATTSGPSETEPTASPFEELESLAEQKYLDGDLETASQLYQQLAELATEPNDATTYLVLSAWLEHQLAKPWRAKALLTQALVIDYELEFLAENYTQDFVDLYNESRGLAAQEIRALAAASVREALEAINRGDLDGARRLLDDVLSKVPDEPFALYNLALIEQREGDPVAATAGYERLFALERSRPGTLTPELREQASLNLGLLYFARGFYEDAETYLQTALRLDPANAKAWNTLGLAFDRQQETADAERAFGEALSRAPDNPQYANNLAAVLLRSNRFGEAAELLAGATSRVTDDPTMWLNYGLALHGLGDLATADDALGKAMTLDPDGSRQVWDQAAQVRIGTAYRLERFDQAIGLADQVLARTPTFVDAHVYAGLAAKALGDQHAAREHLSSAAELAPDRADIQNNLGSVLIILKAYEPAERAFEADLAIQPGMPEAEANLAAVQELLERQRYAGAQPGQIREGSKRPSNRRPIGVRFAEDVDYTDLGLHGVLVDHVEVGSSGYRAGIRPGDLILQVDGYKVASPAELLVYIYQKATASEVVLSMLRNGKPKQVTLDLR